MFVYNYHFKFKIKHLLQINVFYSTNTHLQFSFKVIQPLAKGYKPSARDGVSSNIKQSFKSQEKLSFNCKPNFLS